MPAWPADSVSLKTNRLGISGGTILPLAAVSVQCLVHGRLLQSLLSLPLDVAVSLFCFLGPDWFRFSAQVYSGLSGAEPLLLLPLAVY